VSRARRPGGQPHPPGELSWRSPPRTRQPCRQRVTRYGRWGFDWANRMDALMQQVCPSGIFPERLGAPTRTAAWSFTDPRRTTPVIAVDRRPPNDLAATGVLLAFRHRARRGRLRIVRRAVGCHRSWRGRDGGRLLGLVEGRWVRRGLRRPGEPAGCRCCSRPAVTALLAAHRLHHRRAALGRQPTGMWVHVAARWPCSVGDLARARPAGQATRGRPVPAERDQSGSCSRRSRPASTSPRSRR